MYFRITKENVDYGVENKDRALIRGVVYLGHFMVCAIFLDKNLYTMVLLELFVYELSHIFQDRTLI